MDNLKYIFINKPTSSIIPLNQPKIIIKRFRVIFPNRSISIMELVPFIKVMIHITTS